VFADSGLVITVKVAVVAFAATVTLAGTCTTAVLLLDRVTTAPPGGAARLSFTVAVEEFPPIKELGFRVRELTTAAKTVRVALWVEP
jgi:hypothetical protein